MIAVGVDTLKPKPPAALTARRARGARAHQPPRAAARPRLGGAHARALPHHESVRVDVLGDGLPPGALARGLAELAPRRPPPARNTRTAILRRDRGDLLARDCPGRSGATVSPHRERAAALDQRSSVGEPGARRRPSPRAAERPAEEGISMANLITKRPHVRAARRGRRAGERFAPTLTGRGRGRPRAIAGPAATMAALLVAGGVGALAEYL
jgi:hypothetical protein